MSAYSRSRLDLLGIPRLVVTNLRKAGITTTEGLTALNAEEVLGLFGVAQTSLTRIEAALENRGLALSNHATMIVSNSGRLVEKERPLSSAVVKGYVASVALLRKQADEAQAEADLLRKVAANYKAAGRPSTKQVIW